MLKDEFNSDILHIRWVLVDAQCPFDHQTQLGAKPTLMTVTSLPETAIYKLQLGATKQAF